MPDKKNAAKEKNSQPTPGAADRLERPHALSAGYEIRIRNHLNTCWSEWFDGWVLTNLENGEVLMSQTPVDQSALHGVLNKIRDLNLTLVSVSTISNTNETTDHADPQIQE
jgi:hypothetical protein